jgi:mandelate racemase
MQPELSIRSLRTHAIEVPMRRPLGTSAALMRSAPFLLVELETDEGVTGRAHAFCYWSTALPLLQRIVDRLSDDLSGQAVNPTAVSALLARRLRLLGVHGLVAMALSAIDVACWDALSRGAGTSLANFLGASRAAVPAYNSNGLSIADPASLGEEALALLEPGFNAVKLRLGRALPDEDLQAIAAVRAAVGSATTLMADYNQALTVAAALERGPSLDGIGLAWIEEPVAAGDLVGCARVAAELATPVQIGENLYGPDAVEAAIALQSSDLLMFDLMRIGGVTGWLAAAGSAAEAGIPVSSHLYPEVSVHLLAAGTGSHWLEYVDWAEPFLETPLTVRDGAIEVPPGAGTGVKWDAAAIRRYARA